MKIYTVRFTYNNKKYAHRTTNFKLVKKILKTFKNSTYAYFDYNEL